MKSSNDEFNRLTDMVLVSEEPMVVVTDWMRDRGFEFVPGVEFGQMVVVDLVDGGREITSAPSDAKYRGGDSKRIALSFAAALQAVIDRRP